jgi:hypothetical protein
VEAEVNPQSFEQNRGKANPARNSSLSLAHMQHHVLAVDIADLKMLQFAAAQGCRVERRDDSPVL